MFNNSEEMIVNLLECLNWNEYAIEETKGKLITEVDLKEREILDEINDLSRSNDPVIREIIMKEKNTCLYFLRLFRRMISEVQ